MRMKTESSGRIQTVAVRESAARKEEIRSTHPQATNLTENLIASWRLTLKLSIYRKREASRMDKENTGEQRRNCTGIKKQESCLHIGKC
jgi:hypothetical protein